MSWSGKQTTRSFLRITERIRNQHSVLCLSALLLLTACGFTPLYGTSGTSQISTAEAGLDQIYIASIPDQEGQYLRNALIDRFYLSGRPQNPAYDLHIDKIKELSTELDITKSSSATRAQLRLSTTMSLTDKATGKQLLNRKLSSIASYNILQSHFTTRVSEENTRQNALDDLARQIELQLALYFKRQHGEN